MHWATAPEVAVPNIIAPAQRYNVARQRVPVPLHRLRKAKRCRILRAGVKIAERGSFVRQRVTPETP